MYKVYSWVALFLLITCVDVLAQQRIPTPTLTTEDIVATRPAAPVIPTSAITEKDVAKGKESKQEGQSGTKGTKNPAAEKNAGDAQQNAIKDWNERLKQAQEKASGLERQADQSELEITRLRNQLTSAEPKSPEARGQLNTKISAVAAQLQKLRGEAKIAQQLVAEITTEGNANNYKLTELSLTNEKGEPDATAQQEFQEKTMTEISDAKAKIEVLQLRLRTNQAEILRNGNGDNFTLNRLRAEKEQINEELEKTRTKIAELSNTLSTVR